MTKEQLERWCSELLYGNPPTVEQQRWWRLYKDKMKQKVPDSKKPA